VEVENTAPARSGLAGPSRATGAMRRAAELEQEFWTRMAHVIRCGCVYFTIKMRAAISHTEVTRVL